MVLLSLLGLIIGYLLALDCAVRWARVRVTVTVRLAHSLTCLEVDAHLSVGDWSSAVLFLLTLVKHVVFQSGLSSSLAGRSVFRGFLHQMRYLMVHGAYLMVHSRVTWQAVLAADDKLDYVNLPSRADIADAMVAWDPTIEYRAPDEWGVLLNERRDAYFASHPIEHALVEVLELWMKLRGHTIEAMVRRCGELDGEAELMKVL